MLETLLKVAEGWAEKLNPVLDERGRYWVYRADKRSREWKEYTAARAKLSAALAEYDEAVARLPR